MGDVRARRTGDQEDPPARSARRRRALTVLASCLTTIVVMTGYLVAGARGLVPGVLAVRGTSAASSSSHSYVPGVRAVSDAVPQADLSKSIDKNALRSAVKAFESTSKLGDDYSVAVATADGTIVESRDPDSPRQPASTLKTLTAFAAASRLDMGSTLDTQVYLEHADDSTPTIILKGNGDMLLSSGDDDPDHVNGRAGLGSLATRTARVLRGKGISRVRLVVDDSLFGSVRSPTNIEQNNEDGLYYTPVSSMAVDGGRRWSSGQTPSDPDVFEDYPPLSTHTASDATTVFIRRLVERGIAVEGTASSGQVPDGLTPVASVHSATLTEIMAFMLRHSDNTLAEEFGRLLALHVGEENSPTGAVTAVRDVLRASKISMTGLTMADCSGLSPGSLVSVRTLAAVQSRNLGRHGVSAAAEGLSVSGLVGTAAERFSDSAANGLLRVKTGSLSDVTAMAGTVSRKSGGVLAFAVIVNDPQDYDAAVAAIGSFGSALTGV